MTPETEQFIETAITILFLGFFCAILAMVFSIWRMVWKGFQEFDRNNEEDLS